MVAFPPLAFAVFLARIFKHADLAYVPVIVPLLPLACQFAHLEMNNVHLDAILEPCLRYAVAFAVCVV